MDDIVTRLRDSNGMKTSRSVVCVEKESENGRPAVSDTAQIRITLKVTDISAAHRRYYRRLRAYYSREMAQWVFAGRALSYEALSGPAMMVAVAAATFPNELKEATRHD